MTKIEIFQHEWITRIVEDVNLWLAEHPSVMPENITISTEAVASAESDKAPSTVVITVAVAYEDGDA
jgi:hypothetical protein